MSEQMRKEFEAWINIPCEIDADGEYSIVAIHAARRSWQASRQSLVVKLPELFNATFCDAYEAGAMKEALDDAGVRCE